MSRLTLAAASALALAAAVSLSARSVVARRLHRLGVRHGGTSLAVSLGLRHPASERLQLSAAVRWTGGACAGCGALAAVGGYAGLVLGALVTVVAAIALRRFVPRAVRATREQVARDLPLAADLLAATVAAGCSLPRALDVVAAALGGPLGERLQAVSAALGVGAEPAAAVTALTEPCLLPLRRTLARAGSSGAPVAAVVAELAAEVREQRAARVEEAVQRAGVLAVLPLGLCFLPAFVLLGVVPVVIGLATVTLRVP